jgi:hypothetical protein
LFTELARTLNKRRKADNKGSSHEEENQASSHEEKFSPLITSKIKKQKTAKDNLIIIIKGNRSNKIKEDSNIIKIAEINYEKYEKRLKISLYKENEVVIIYIVGIPPPSESLSAKELKRFKLSMFQVIQKIM